MICTSMTYAQLRAFHHVALSGGFSRAAETLRLSQPAISEQVRNLERDHDVLLFRRDRRQVALTKAGEALFALTRQFFDVEARIGDLMSESRAAVEGELRLVVDAAHHVTEILNLYRQAHPRVRIRLQTGNTERVLAELRNFTADVGVIGAEASEHDLDAVPLGHSPIIAFAAKGFAGVGPDVTLEQLAKLPLVLREQGSKTRAGLEAEATRRGLRLTPAIIAEGREAVRHIVASGAGIGITSAAEFSPDRRLKALPIMDIDVTMSETIVCLSQRRDVRAIRAFMDIAEQITPAAGG